MPSPPEEPLRLLKYNEDRIPVAVFFTITIIDFALYLLVDQVWALVTYSLAMIPIKALVSAWNHHHQHVPMFRSKALNRVLEMAFALQTGATTHAWTLHHVHGHHKNYLDQDKDESRWRRPSGEQYGFVTYALWTALTAYPRAFRVGRSHPRLQRAFVGYGLLTVAIIATLVVIKPVSGLILFAVPPVISLVITVAATYLHHSGLDTDNPLEASRNYTGQIRNALTGNLGYHTAHHYRQGLHWSKLPELHASLADRIPADQIRS